MTILTINSDTMGKGDDQLGRQLIASCLRKLWAAERRPDAIIFYNAGVKLLADGSPVLDAAAGLSEAGVDLVACGTCIGYLGLKERLRAGRVSDMQEIVRLLMEADKTITL
jgi:selenium metabolism protein YedF